MRFLTVIEAEAERELAEAVDFYDEREPGKGQQLARDVRDVFKAVCEHPERFPIYSRLTRKAKVLDWPYSIYYAINFKRSELVIIAVWHGARNPTELRRRLK